MAPENIPCISAAKIDCCALANNHVLDWGYAGLQDTLAALAKAGRTMEIDDDALALLVSEGYSAEYGARFLKRTIDERVKMPISMHWRDAAHFHVMRKDGAVVVVPVALRVVHAAAAVA